MAIQQKLAKTTIQIVATAIAAAALLILFKATLGMPKWAGGQATAGDEAKESTAHASQPFEDLKTVAQFFADELGRLKAENHTTSPAELMAQADANNRRDYTLPAPADSAKKLDPETIYARSKSGVVVVGGIFKCSKCEHWHAQCASGFVIRRDGLIVTNLHVLEGCKKLDALGIMTDNGRVFPIKAVLASSRLNDLALLKVDTETLSPLPLSLDVAVGATVFCLSHPSLPGGKGNAFYTFSRGSVCGKSILHNEKNEPLRVLAVTADYGPGSSGGPILNERGEVVGIVCQAIPLCQLDHDKDVQMIWRFARPSCSILDLLSPPAGSRESSVAKTPPAAAQVVEKESSPSAPRAALPTDSAAGPFELVPSDRTMGYYRPVQVKLGEKPPLPPGDEPQYAAKNPLYGVLRLGSAPENRHLVALDEPDGGKPQIYIDDQGDGDLKSAGPRDWNRIVGGNFSLNNITIDVRYPTRTIPSKYNVFRKKERQPDLLFYYRASSREGAAILDGLTYKVLVQDDNSDGRYDDLQNGSLIIDLNRDGNLEGEPDSAESFRLSEPFNVGGKVWKVASMSADGLSIVLQRSDKRVPAKPYLTPGNPAPAFKAELLGGGAFDLKAEAAKSKYVLVDFWASWCGPCRAEFPTMRRIHARYKNYGMKVVGVTLDSDESKAIDAAKKASLTYSHVFDGKGWNNAVAQLYRVRGIPQVYLLDSQLKIVAKNLRGVELEKRLRDLLGPGDESAASK
jgi:S1-C subfamily serine protease/thiol-disulfide isomerase/thioredoxin